MATLPSKRDLARHAAVRNAPVHRTTQGPVTAVMNRCGVVTQWSGQPCGFTSLRWCSDGKKRCGTHARAFEIAERKRTNAGRTVDVIGVVRDALTEACGFLEVGDQRLLAGDGPVGNQPPDIDLKEWRRMYKVLDHARAVLRTMPAPGDVDADEPLIGLSDGTALLRTDKLPPADLRYWHQYSALTDSQRSELRDYADHLAAVRRKAR